MAVDSDKRETENVIVEQSIVDRQRRMFSDPRNYSGLSSIVLCNVSAFHRRVVDKVKPSTYVDHRAMLTTVQVCLSK